MIRGALSRSLLLALLPVVVLVTALPAQAGDFAFSGWQMADADGVVNLPIRLSTLADPRVFEYMPARTSDWYDCPSVTQINWYTSSNCTAYVQAYYKYFRTFLYVSGAMSGQTIYVRADGHIDDVVNVLVNGTNTGQYLHGLALPGSRQADITSYLNLGQVNEILFRFADTAALNRGITQVSIRTGTGIIAAYDPTITPHQVTITETTAEPDALPAGGGTTQCRVTATDGLGHPLSYSWTASSSLGPGAFDDPSSSTPTWTSPANNTGSDVTAILTVTATCAESQSAQASVTVTIPPTRPPETGITRFGQNFWNWVGYWDGSRCRYFFDDYRDELAARVRASGVAFLRFGGRENEVLRCTPCEDEDQPRKGEDCHSWCRFGPTELDRFINFCQQVGAEPIVQIPVWGYLMNGKSDNYIVGQAADLVQYCRDNHPGVQYWSIGNEPDLWSVFALLEHHQIFTYTAEQFCDIFRRIAGAVREGDPHAKIVGPDLGMWLISPDFAANWNTWSAIGRGQILQLLTEQSRAAVLQTWIDTFLQRCAQDIDFFSIHYYPAPSYLDAVTLPWVPKQARSHATVDLTSAMRQWAFYESAGLLDRMLAYIRNKAAECGRPGLPIIVTEANIQGVGRSAPFGTSSSLDPTTEAAAVWLAQTMGQMVKQDVQAMCFWSIINDDGLDYLSANPIAPRPTYHVFSLIANATAGMQAWVERTIRGPGDVDAWAVTDGQGKLVVVLYNRSQSGVYAVQLVSETGARRAEVSAPLPVTVYLQGLPKPWQVSVGPVTLSAEQVRVIVVGSYGEWWHPYPG